jgi:hypothetical protein
LDTTAIRFGGAFGVICALTMIPAFVIGTHDSSTAFVATNGIVPLLHILFGLAFLGFLPLVHTWVPLPAAFSSLVWILLIGLVMPFAPGGTQETALRVNDDAPGIRN